MAANPQQELIWQGRLHLGDEPGVYGDAHYAGLCAEMPITAYRSNPADTNSVEFRVVLETEALETYPGYAGHCVSVTIYEPDPNQPFHSIERVIAQEQFTGKDNNRKEVVVAIGNTSGPFRLSVRIRCDTTVNPGFYDDFVWIRLSLLSDNFAFYASLGFPN